MADRDRELQMAPMDWLLTVLTLLVGLVVYVGLTGGYDAVALFCSAGVTVLALVILAVYITELTRSRRSSPATEHGKSVQK